MVDWDNVTEELNSAGYSGFKFESGRTVIEELSGEWVVGKIPREGELAHDNLPTIHKFLELIPFISASPTNPDYVPKEIKEIAKQYGLNIIIVSVGDDYVQIALCE